MNKKLINLEEHKEILLNIMDDIDTFCRQNNISYFLLGGSLIGAVRHKGFIPWDDDIDIAMLREDYDRFLSIYSTDKNSKYQLLSLETDPLYAYPFAKVIDTRTKLDEAIDSRDDLGVYVDVFPIDACPSKYEEACKFQKRIARLRWIRNAKMIPIEKRRNIFKNILLAIAKGAAIFITRRSVSKKISKQAQQYKNSTTELVGQLSGNVYGSKEIWRREWFTQLIDAEFEGRNYLIPKCYHEVLTTTFGDYMKLPPKEKQISHHDFIAYWR